MPDNELPSNSSEQAPISVAPDVLNLVDTSGPGDVLYDASTPRLGSMVLAGAATAGTAGMLIGCVPEFVANRDQEARINTVTNVELIKESDIPQNVQGEIQLGFQEWLMNTYAPEHEIEIDQSKAERLAEDVDIKAITLGDKNTGDAVPEYFIVTTLVDPDRSDFSVPRDIFYVTKLNGKITILPVTSGVESNNEDPTHQALHYTIINPATGKQEVILKQMFTQDAAGELVLESTLFYPPTNVIKPGNAPIPSAIAEAGIPLPSSITGEIFGSQLAMVVTLTPPSPGASGTEAVPGAGTQESQEPVETVDAVEVGLRQIVIEEGADWEDAEVQTYIDAFKQWQADNNMAVDEAANELKGIRTMIKAGLSAEEMTEWINRFNEQDASWEPDANGGSGAFFDESGRVRWMEGGDELINPYVKQYAEGMEGEVIAAKYVGPYFNAWAIVSDAYSREKITANARGVLFGNGLDARTLQQLFAWLATMPDVDDYLQGLRDGTVGPITVQTEDGPKTYDPTKLEAIYEDAPSFITSNLAYYQGLFANGDWNEIARTKTDGWVPLMQGWVKYEFKDDGTQVARIAVRRDSWNLMSSVFEIDEQAAAYEKGIFYVLALLYLGVYEQNGMAWPDDVHKPGDYNVRTDYEGRWIPVLRSIPQAQRSNKPAFLVSFEQ